MAERLDSDCQQLRRASVKVTAGDRRCMLFGYLTRLVVQQLSSCWDSKTKTTEKLKLVREALERIRVSLLVVEAEPSDNFEHSSSDSTQPDLFNASIRSDV